jgi:hypothetical protein
VATDKSFRYGWGRRRAVFGCFSGFHEIQLTPELTPESLA